MLDYDAAIEQLAAKIKPEAFELLCRVRDACREAGMRTDDEPFDMSADDYSFSLRVWRAGHDGADESIAVSVEIGEERSYEQPDSTVSGINFSLDIVEFGGRILGGICPFNYTELCWVALDSTERIEHRWSLVRDVDVTPIPQLINEAT